ncbi:MAG: molecular chaperone DnaJ [Halieaceae bacterium]
MPRLILLIAIGLAGWIIYRQIQAMPAAQRKSAYLKVGIGVLLVVVVIATLTGRMHWLGAAITAVLVGVSRLAPHLLRLLPLAQWLHGQKTRAAGSPGSGNSQVETSLLRMQLDHASGDLNGEVLDGEFKGAMLDDLDRPQLESLLAWCRGRDIDSARLLESYLQRRFGDSWQGESTAPPNQGSSMAESEALAILGLQAGASKEEIVDSHRRLMQKLHPDRGGNDYLAAKLNQAKDFLLG